MGNLWFILFHAPLIPKHSLNPPKQIVGILGVLKKMSQRLPPISMSDFSLSISTPHYAGGQSLPLCSELFSA